MENKTNLDQEENQYILLKELEKYNGIFSKEILKYFESLIALEFSALNENNLSKDKMSLLNGVELYRKIVAHNIFYNAIKICQKKYDFLQITKGYNNKSLHIQEMYNEKSYDIFDFQCIKDNISIIDLYETLDNTPKREEVINSLQEKIHHLEENTRLLNNYISSKAWELELLKNELTTLQQRNNLQVDDELYIASIRNDFLKDILDLYGIDEADFEEKEIKPFILQSKNNSSLDKRLIKSYPHTTVIRNTRYY